MTINFNSVGQQNPNRVETSKPTDNTQQTNKGTEDVSSDSVELSNQTHELNKLHDQVNQLPDVDSNRVAAITQALVNGTYEVSADRIAEKMLQGQFAPVTEE